MPNCLGEFREIGESKQRTGSAPYGHPAGTNLGQIPLSGIQCQFKNRLGLSLKGQWR